TPAPSWCRQRSRSSTKIPRRPCPRASCARSTAATRARCSCSPRGASRSRGGRCASRARRGTRLGSSPRRRWPTEMATFAPKGVSRRVYDVAVLGPDVGGAAAAALCARSGLRTLLAPMQPVSAVRESEGWLLPGAHPVIAPLRQLNAAAVTLDELGLGADLQRHTGPAQ